MGTFYRPRSLANQGDNVLGSVCPSVCLDVCALLCEPFDLCEGFGFMTVWLRPMSVRKWGYRDITLGVAGPFNCAYAVDQLLISNKISAKPYISSGHLFVSVVSYATRCLIGLRRLTGLRCVRGVGCLRGLRHLRCLRHLGCLRGLRRLRCLGCLGGLGCLWHLRGLECPPSFMISSFFH